MNTLKTQCYDYKLIQMCTQLLHIENWLALKLICQSKFAHIIVWSLSKFHLHPATEKKTGPRCKFCCHLQTWSESFWHVFIGHRSLKMINIIVFNYYFQQNTYLYQLNYKNRTKGPVGYQLLFISKGQLLKQIYAKVGHFHHN